MTMEGVPLIPSTDTIRAMLAERVDSFRLSVGLSVGTSDPDGVRQFASYGLLDHESRRSVTSDTVFEIGSVTKLYTALLLADMAYRREVSLDDPVAIHLPSEIRVPQSHGRSISLSDLARHTSGLPRMPTNFAPKDPANPYADYTEQHLYDFLSSHSLTRCIGQPAHYSNLGYCLLGHALARRAGMDYESLVTSRICTPLGLRTTAITLSPAMTEQLATGHDDSLEPVPNWDLGLFAGAGGLRSSAQDQLTFLEAFGNETPLTDAIRIMTALPDDGGLGVAARTRDGYSVVAHQGGTGGYRAVVRYARELRRAVVVLSNAGINAVADLTMHLLDSRRPRHWYRQEVEVDPDLFGRYVGRYRMTPSFILTVTREADRLYVQATGQDRLRAFPCGERQFFYKVVGAQITFELGADQRAQRLILHQNSLDQVAERIE